MIRLERIEIKEFRGIRNLELELKGQNFAACGPNGTGKSGIVDAIEFALTGNISRLTGTGTGGLSVKSHGPHVDSRNNPEIATVTLDIILPSLGNKKARVYRSVKASGAPKITPPDEDIIRCLDYVSCHPEFVLSRRELIRYVLSEPGQRSKEVQALLRLDDLEKLRRTLKKIANSSSKELGMLERAKTGADERLRMALGTSDLSERAFLDAVNSRRAILALPRLEHIDDRTSVKDGLVGLPVSEAVPKVRGTTELRALRDVIARLNSSSFIEACGTAKDMAAALAQDSGTLLQLSRHELIKSAVEQFDGDACPVCDTPFEPGAFRRHLFQKLVRLEAVRERRKALEDSIQPILDTIHSVGNALGNVIDFIARYLPKVDGTPLLDFRAVLRTMYLQLKRLLPLEETQLALSRENAMPNIGSTLELVQKAIDELAEPTERNAAREFLILVQERLDNRNVEERRLKAARLRVARVLSALAIYDKVTNKALEDIYRDVENTFAAYYRQINEEDEQNFTAELRPSVGRLALDVDFYGRGHFPPGAYHSEGHQDGMGLCLYLALMNHLMGKNFTFAVLDDVLMSVDSGHRRQVCTLLRKSFPHTQFLFTTHDEIWLRHMKSEGLIQGRNLAHFREWTVEHGPTEWDGRDVWAELDSLLMKGDVRAAAALLRHFLEYFSKEACDRLRAKVEFRGDAQFMLGDLLPQATSALGDLFKKAKVCANSWNQKDTILKIEAIERSFGAAKKMTNQYSWEINTAVHFNEWADLSKEDFAPLVRGFEEFTGSFSCKDCGGMYFVTPSRGKKEAVRCGCGNLNLNLCSKPS